MKSPSAALNRSPVCTLAPLKGISSSGAVSHNSTKNHVSSKRHWVNETGNAQKENGCDALTTLRKHEVRVMEG